MNAWAVVLFSLTVLTGLLALVLGVVLTAFAKRERRQLARGIPLVRPEREPVSVRGILAKKAWAFLWNRVPATIRITGDGLDVQPVLLARQRFRWGDIAAARWQGHFSPLKWVWVVGGPVWVLHLALWDRRELELGVWGLDAAILASRLRAAGVDAGMGRMGEWTGPPGPAS